MRCKLWCSVQKAPGSRSRGQREKVTALALLADTAPSVWTCPEPMNHWRHMQCSCRSDVKMRSAHHRWKEGDQGQQHESMERKHTQQRPEQADVRAKAKPIPTRPTKVENHNLTHPRATTSLGQVRWTGCSSLRAMMLDFRCQCWLSATWSQQRSPPSKPRSTTIHEPCKLWW